MAGNPSFDADERGKLAVCLHADRQTIVGEWMNAVRNDAQIPNADRLTLTALQDHFPEMLAELTEALRRARSEADNPETRRTGREHGKARWRSGYRLDEVLRELARVREIILARVLRFCSDDGAEALRHEAGSKVRQFFDAIVATSAQQFVQQQEAEILLRSQQLQHAYEQVQAATEQLREVAQSRLRLLRGVSHELRNALQAVEFAAAALLEEGDAEGQRSISSKLNGSVARLQRLLDRLQEFSAILSGECGLAVQTLDVHRFLDELHMKYLPAAEEKRLELRVSDPHEVTAVTIDAGKLWRIADVLIANAITHTSRGSVEVGIQKDEPDRWIFWVEDTGSGIDENSAKLIFQEFHRSGPTDQQGTGLGLVFARHLAHLMDAEITFRSTVGVGSRFEVNLPLDLSKSLPAPDATSFN